MSSVLRRGICSFAFAVALPSLLALAARATPVFETSLSSFEGKEEPTVLYHPSTATFTSDSYVNMTDQGSGVVRFTLRYHPDVDWWDGDRNTTNTDRQRTIQGRNWRHCDRQFRRRGERRHGYSH